MPNHDEEMKRVYLDQFGGEMPKSFERQMIAAMRGDQCLPVSDWEKAHRLGKRAFYERRTQTIRACPENYCLADGGPGRWAIYSHEAATKRIRHKIQAVIDEYSQGSTSQALADGIGKVLPDQGHWFD